MIDSIQLISPTLGTEIIRKGFPVDINALQSELKRSKDTDGVIRQVVIDLKFIKRGRAFVKRCFEQSGGPDAKLLCNVYWLNPNTRQKELYCSGQANFANYELTEDTLVIDVEQTGFQRLIENSMNIPVDLSTLTDIFGNTLAANPPINLPLHAKTLQKVYQKTGQEQGSALLDDGVNYFIPGSGLGILIAPSLHHDDLFLDQIQTRVELQAGLTNVEPTSDKFYFIKAKVGGTYHFKSFITSSINCPGKTFTDYQFKFVYGQPGGYTTVNVGTPISASGNAFFAEKSVDFTITLNPSDEVYFFASFTLGGGGGPMVVTAQVDTVSYPDFKYFMQINALTKATDSIAKAYLLHEAFKRTIQFYTGQEDCFESPLLGRTDLGYAEDGQGSLVAITNGNNIRLRTKPINASLRDLLGITNSLYGTGMTYKTVNGVQKIVLDTKDKFYDKTLRALNLGKVYNVRRRLDINRLFNQIQFGYSHKIDLDQINATDAFNTLRNYVLPLRNSKNKLDFSNAVIADGYQIEYQRSFINSTNDAKLDDENFLIQCIRDGLNFKAKKDEGYDLITGVIDPSSGYNYDIAPARCVRNWLKYIAASLIYSQDKLAKFAAGTVNFELATQKTGEDLIKENDPVSLFGVVPIWRPFILEFEVQRLSVADFQELVEKATGYIEFQDNFGNTFKGFIDEGVTHNPTTLAATFQLLEMFE